jgi:hypothetical protein
VHVKTTTEIMVAKDQIDEQLVEEELVHDLFVPVYLQLLLFDHRHQYR